MNKIWLIIKREYWTKVSSKAFIWGTLLTPVIMALYVMFNVGLAMYKDDNVKKIAIIDQGHILKTVPKAEKNLSFTLSTESLDSLKAKIGRKEYNAALVIPPISDFSNKKLTVQLYSDDRFGSEMSGEIKDKIAKRIREYKIDSMKLDTGKIKMLESEVRLDPFPIIGKEKKETAATNMVATGIGGAMGLFMYFAVFLYGMMVMRSVMEEKTNRIVEVMISSVKPFQLMMGKILGVGAAGLTQIIAWVVMGFGIMAVLVPMMSGDAIKTQQMQQAQQNPQAAEAMADPSFMVELANQNWLTILPLFIIFFFLGYMLYASLFAAVGAAIGDDIGESQSLTMPITIPVILAVVIMFRAVQAPDSSLAVWASIFPLFSPIVMPARLAFHPPVWQIILSVTVLIGTVLFTVWMAGRIYRIGILMYGKKITFKEMGKWLFYKE
jgi:ABC-2 type transport system permease protein